METEQRSTLTINQEQLINLGTLFARSSNRGQAVLTLSPSGSYTINVGDFTVTKGLGETTYAFKLGATLTTEPTTSEQIYQEGVNSGTFTVTVSYRMETGNIAKSAASKPPLLVDCSVLGGNDNRGFITTAY